MQYAIVLLKTHACNVQCMYNNANLAIARQLTVLAYAPSARLTNL